jgi:hypothetical protein
VEPTEPFIRVEDLPAAAVLIVRAGPVTAEKLIAAARREQAIYTWRGSPLTCVSAEAVMGEWTLERVLSEHLTTRTTYATTTVRQVLSAGLVLLPTFAAPHYDVVLEDATVEQVARLMSILSEPIRNPYRRKGRL